MEFHKFSAKKNSIQNAVFYLVSNTEWKYVSTFLSSGVLMAKWQMYWIVI